MEIINGDLVALAKDIIKKELKDCTVTTVIYNK